MRETVSIIERELEIRISLTVWRLMLHGRLRAETKRWSAGRDAVKFALQGVFAHRILVDCQHV